MKRIRIVGLALVAMFAFSALVASAAQAAAPEFTVHPDKITKSTTTATYTLETVGGSKVTCKAQSNEGEIETAKTGFATITFTGCETTVIIKVKCETKGAATGEVKTNKLLTTLGVSGSTTAIKLAPEGELFAELECAGAAIKVKGAVVCPITPVGGGTHTSFSLACAQTKGVQSLTSFEGVAANLETSISGGTYEQSGQSGTGTLTVATANEIN
jgi:hypothetical protein